MFLYNKSYFIEFYYPHISLHKLNGMVYLSDNNRYLFWYDLFIPYFNERLLYSDFS